MKKLKNVSHTIFKELQVVFVHVCGRNREILRHIAVILTRISTLPTKYLRLFSRHSEAVGDAEFLNFIFYSYL